MKVMRLGGQGFPIMHVKSIILDDEVVLTGSVNMTHNGHENNKEHLFRIANKNTVEKVVADFERDWAATEPVTDLLVDTMMKNYDARMAKQGKHHRTPSISQSRSTSRSLDTELEEVGTELAILESTLKSST